jgi:hypothetical protein
MREYGVDLEPAARAECLSWLLSQMGSAPYLSGTRYTIADMAVWPWYGAHAKALVYEAGEFLQVADYKNVQRWTDAIAKRPAVQRGRMVNRISGDPASCASGTRRATSTPRRRTRSPPRGSSFVFPGSLIRTSRSARLIAIAFPSYRSP